MKKKVFSLSLIMLLTLAISSFCQNLNVKIYFDKGLSVCKPEQYSFYRQANWDTTINFYSGKFIDYSNNGKKLIEGTYINKLKQGNFIFYNENEEIALNGYFKNDLPDSLWTWFYPNKKEHFKIKFTKDDFDIIDIKDENGKTLLGKKFSFVYEFQNDKSKNQMIVKGNLVNYKKEGKWTVENSITSLGYDLYENGVCSKTVHFSIDPRTFSSKVINNTLFVPYSIYACEELSTNSDVSETEYPFSNKLNPWKPILEAIGFIGDSSFIFMDSKPKYIDGINGVNKVIYDNVRLNEEYVTNCNQFGTVYFELVINELGYIESKKIIRSPNKIISNILLPAIDNLKSFKPAILNGKPIKSKFISKMKFERPIVIGGN